MEGIIKKALREAGFDAVGIASADPLLEDDRRFRRWIEKGFSAEMEYLRTEARARSDPGRYLPGARSVIVATGAYASPRRPPGPIAAYALHSDYHLVFREALQKGVEAIEGLDPKARCRIAVDSSPLLERALAIRAGLGWIGYSTNLVTPSFGPFVLLGVIVTTLSLRPDCFLEDHTCAECRRCIDACPTGALAAPYRLDARKCISYLTIEKKGPFNDEEAARINGWVFGCDLCTAACMEGKASPPMGTSTAPK